MGIPTAFAMRIHAGQVRVSVRGRARGRGRARSASAQASKAEVKLNWWRAHGTGSWVVLAQALHATHGTPDAARLQ